MTEPKLAMDKASVRTIDRDGRLHVAISNISKAAIDPYYGYEIPDGERMGLDPQKVYYLLRDPDELAAGAATFNNLPILSKHVPVTAKAPQQELIIGSTGTDASFEAPYLRNSLVFWTEESVNAIDDESARELSSAYHYRADMTAGVFNGLRYDGIMRDIVGNHVITTDDGRAGSDVVVMDEMPRGITMLKSKAAFMLNGALAALIAPKLAMDAKPIDFSGTLSGVTRGNMSKTSKALATKIVALVKPHLAMDEGMDVDDVVKLIGAVSGSPDLPAEDDDMIGEEAEEAAPPAVDADGDMLSKVMAFLKGKLSDEDMTELGTMVGGAPAADEEPDDEPGNPPQAKPAMDAKSVARVLNDMRTAEREVRPFIGEITVAMDSASDIYRLALDKAGIDLKGVHPSAFRSMVGMLPRADAPAPLSIAMDSGKAATDFAKRFPEAKPLLAS